MTDWDRVVSCVATEGGPVVKYAEEGVGVGQAYRAVPKTPPVPFLAPSVPGARKDLNIHAMSQIDTRLVKHYFRFSVFRGNLYGGVSIAPRTAQFEMNAYQVKNYVNQLLSKYCTVPGCAPDTFCINQECAVGGGYKIRVSIEMTDSPIGPRTWRDVYWNSISNNWGYHPGYENEA